MVNKITRWLYLEPLLFNEDWIHLSEISKKLGKNHSVVRQYLNEFEKQGFIKKQQKGRMNMYKINSDYPLILDILVLVEKEKLISKEKNLIIKEVAGFLHKNLPRESKAVIFGSSVDNSKRANDIDILISGKDMGTKIKELERNINKKVHLIEVRNLNEVTEALKEEIKKTHLIVQGSEEVIKWLI